MTVSLCLVAAQRAGTTALLSALGSSGQCFNFGEVFQTKNLPRPGSFFDFARGEGLLVHEMATGDQAQSVASRYADHLQELAGAKRPVFSVLFESWHALRSAWGYPHERPLLLQTLQARRCVFLFIRRRELVEQVISHLIARQTDKWHDVTEADVDQAITIDAPLAAQRARLIVLAESLFLDHLRKRPRPVLSICYEDLFHEGRVNSRLVAALNQRMQVDMPLALTPPIRRNALDKRRIVANYAEAAAAIQAAVAGLSRGELINQVD